MSLISRGRTAACKDTFGGVKNVYLWAWNSYPFFQIRGVKRGNLTSYPTTRVYQFETVSNTNTYEESLIDDNAYNQSLTADLKKIDAETTLDLDNYQDIRLGVIVEDYNGFFRLMGAYNGCDLESLKVSYGSNSSDFNGYQLEIKASERFKAPLFNALGEVGFADNDIIFLANNFEARVLADNGIFEARECLIDLLRELEITDPIAILANSFNNRVIQDNGEFESKQCLFETLQEINTL